MADNQENIQIGQTASEQRREKFQPAPEKKHTGAKGILHMLFMRKWHPQPTVSTTILIFAVVGVLFIILGIVISIFNSTVIEKEISDYQDESNCEWVNQEENICRYKFQVPSEGDMKPPIFVFYSLDNFYQNHRRYMKSKSNEQLAGDEIDESAAKEFCDPIVYNEDLDLDTTQYPIYSTLDPKDIASPCGLIAKSFFNDRFELYEDENFTQQIQINEKGIAWPEDIDNKYKQAKKNPEKQWIDPSNEHFIVWMRTSGLPNFRKLWGRIEGVTLKSKQTYYLKIYNVYNVKQFKGAKGVVLSTAGPLGGKNPFLAAAFIVVGIICIIIALVFLFKKSVTSGSFGEAKTK